MEFPAGLYARETVVVESSAHLANVMREANSLNTPVLPVGGGTYLSTGNPVEHEFIALDMSQLSGVENYIPTDMTASFLAGTPLTEVRAALAANGQELPVDLDQEDAGTIGGLVATGYAGARRLGQGTLKDVLIGCEYVRGDGLIAKAGGMTVKNVSGFEVSRLLHGSWGSLAVLTRVNLKVLPVPRGDRTFTWYDASLSMALDRQLRLITNFPACVALETSVGHKGCATSIRFTGRESAMDDYEQQLHANEGTPDEVHDGAIPWTPIPAAAEAPFLVASGSLDQSRALALELNTREGIAHVAVSLPLGTVRAGVSPGALRASDLARMATGLWMIEGGDSTWKNDAPVWGPESGDRKVALSVKQQFDPAGILNRGRLFI